MMNMKRTLYKLIGCALLLAASVLNSNAANGIIETRNYKICPGDTISVTVVNPNREVVVFKDTVWQDTIRVADPSLDSIYQFVVNVYPRFELMEYKELEVGQSFEWCGTTITQAGIYERRYHSQHGCDSIHRLTVTEHVYTTVEHHVMDTLCSGSSMSFGGKTISEAGVYRDTVHLSHYDSVVVLTLNVVKPDTTITYKRIPEGTTTEWNGEDYSQSGIYDKLFTNRFGCDSLSRLILSVIKTDTIDTTALICQGDALEWRGQTLHAAGEYFAYEQPDGKDQKIHRLTLTVQPKRTTYLTDTLCQGGSITFGDTTLNTTGVYSRTELVNGCDSTIVLTLTVAKRDTTKADIRIPEGTSWEWDGEDYSIPGIYSKMFTNRFGCDSLSQLILSTYRVDTIDTTVIICPSTTFTWHGMTQGTTGDYEIPGTRPNGDQVYYRLHLTVKELAQIDTTFTLCDEESLTFHGKTYVNAGQYFDQYTCDTLFRITIVKHPSQLHLQTGVLDRTNPYYWQYTLDGEQKTDTIYNPGVYEHTSHNAETGCNDTWRLILTKDETVYHYVEYATICESEDYEWHGLTGLNKLGIGQTIHYFDRHRTIADQDSTYELILTVNPVLRQTQTIPFCGSIEWNGQTYTESKTIIDTLTSVRYNCDSIVTTILAKGTTLIQKDTAYITPGETILWRGQTIDQDGHYEERVINESGCENIYSIEVILKPAPIATNTLTERATACEGEGYEWRGDIYYNSGEYIDTVKKGGEIDSLYILHLTVYPKYASTERLTFHKFPQSYRGQAIPGPGTYTFNYHTVFGCDSIITAYVDSALYRTEETVVICPDSMYIWKWTKIAYSEPGVYTVKEKDAEGKDSIEHVLNLSIRYIPQTNIEATICKGQTYVFGEQTLTESGVYYYTFHKTGGCDSTVVLSLNVLSPDTTYLPIQRPQGETYQWGTQTITEPGMYFRYGTNRFGCDSVSILNFTYNQVDTIADTLTVCPTELPFKWNGIEANQTKEYTRLEKLANGNFVFYHLNLTVRDVIQVDTTFSICAGGSIRFNGETYDAAGHYRSYLNCDTLMNVHIIEHQPVIYETYGTITDDHGYTWNYIDHGTPGSQTFTTPGTYEYENPNEETGCNDIYRLILTKDETEYHFEYSQTICEGDDFEWQGMKNLSGVIGTNTYEIKYETRAGKDSIYTLHLTVVPVERTVRSVVFCGETSWNGLTITKDTVVYDTIPLATGCFRIERTNYDKQYPFYHTETKELPQGTVLHWHGQNITTDGTFYDYNTTVSGCDSIYEINVTIIPAAPQNNQYAEELSTCEGDTIIWRGMNIWRSGVYVDTVKKDGTDLVDSVFTLHFTAWPAPKDTIYQHLYTCNDGSSIRYNGKDYYTDQTIITNFHTIHGCDSVVKVYLHFNTALYLSESDTISDKELPYTWTYKLADTHRHDTVLTQAGTYTHIVQAEGGCTNQEELVLIVFPTYLYELDTTVCETALPFEWRGKQLQHTIGETKQYEDAFKTINNTDSIYRVNLTIVEAPRRTERISICENKDTLINGKSYFDNELYPVGQIFHDTITKLHDGNECDSIIYYEITKVPQRHIIETRILHLGESFEWHGETISEQISKTYTKEDEIDPETGCEIIYQIRVVKEDREYETICVLDTADYSWRGLEPRTGGIYTDTIYDGQGYLTEFHSLYLQIDTVTKITENYYVCAGSPEVIYGRTFGDDPLQTDTVIQFTLNGAVPGNKCRSELTVVVTVSRTKIHEQTVVLLEGESLDWNKYHIVQGGEYRDTTVLNQACDSIDILHVILEHRKEITICTNDTAADVHPDYRYPYVWTHDGNTELENDTLYTSGIYTDTLYNDRGFMQDYYTLHLHITQPYDTTVYVLGCENTGAYWRDEIYTRDTTFVDRIPVNPYDPNAPCDSVFHVNIKIEKVYTTLRYDTICEHNLPYVVGQGTQLDSAYREGWLPPFKYKTSCGCDSIVEVHLTIIPDFDIDHSDSIFVCEESMPMYIGDTVHPAFDPYRQKVDEWKDKWIGVKISNDTVIYNCNKVDSLHIIMRPHQSHIPEYEYSLCKGDSVQLFWPHKDTWYKEPGDYMDTIPTISSWEDMTHHTLIHNDRAFACDSIVKWKVRYADTLHVHLYEHIRQGETYVFNDSILSTTGAYDSIGYYQDIKDPLDPTAPGVSSMDSAHHYCKAVYTLHLTVDPVYVYGDTIEICQFANKEYTYTFNDDLEEHFQFKFQTPEQDTATIHLSDSLQHLSYGFYDHYYNLVVYYKQTYFTQITDTLCYGDSIQFDKHSFDIENNTTIERYIKEAGTYRDTLRALNGCDSIIERNVVLRDRIIIEPQSVIVTDRELPYEWTNTWREPGSTRDTTHTDSLYVTGDYTYTMPNRFGCDSTVVLHFTVHPTHVFRDTIDVCAPGKTTHTHFWNTGYQQKFTVPASDDTISYADTLTTFYPLDSIYVLFVNYYEQTITYLDSTICYGDSIQFGLTKSHQPRFLSKSNVYRDTLVRTANGCDSIIELRLNVFPRYLNAETMHFADKEMPYVWPHIQNGDTIARDTIRATGEYVFRFTNAFGCDSIDSLSVRVHQTYLYRDSVQICQSETPYAWEGILDIYETGEYTKHLQTHDGYDSTRVIFVQVMPIQYDTITATICEGDSMRFGLTKSGQPRFLTKTGQYNDTLKTLHGCDSIITLTLNFYPKYSKHQLVDIADVEAPYVWAHVQGGDTIASDTLIAAGEYKYVFKTIPYGCDSIDSLSLRIHATYEFHDTVKICFDQTPYTWYGEDGITIFKKDIYETGEYVKHLQTHDGYDSTLIRYVEVLPVIHKTIHHSICEGSDYLFNGVQYTEDGTYVDTLTAANGCDSIVTLVLKVNKSVNIRIPVDIYEGESYEFYGETYTESGTYRHYDTTLEGCDSITELFLRVHPQIDSTVILCSSELPYIWVNKWTGRSMPLYQEGIYRNDTAYVNGQRTFYTLQLIVNKPVQDTVRAAVCAGHSYQFQGVALTESGIYRDTVKAHNGCDSVTVLVLTVNEPYYNFREEHIFEGDTVEFFGEKYFTSDTYYHHSETDEGCDSTSVLQLIVHPLVDTIVTVCEPELPYLWVNKWNGTVTPLYNAGLYRNDTTYVGGKRMFYGLLLNVSKPVYDTTRVAICKGSSYTFKGVAITEAGVYRDTLRAHNGCDSIETLILTVNEPYYSFREEHIFEGDTVEFFGEKYFTSDTYYHHSETDEGCDSTSVLQLIVHPLVDTIVTVCEPELPYLWVNKWNGAVTPLYNAGLYRNDTTYVNGKRMFYGLLLNVSKPVYDTTRVAICKGSSHTFKGVAITEAGIYRDTLRAHNGCDSIETLILTVNEPYFGTRTEHIFEGDTVEFFGGKYFTTGTYYYHSETNEGCDSTSVLQLIVHPLVDTVVTVCKSDLPYLWVNKWNSSVTPLYNAGIYRNDTTYVGGERMFYGLQLIVNEPTDTTIYRKICEGDLYNFNNRLLDTSGEYRDTIKNVNGCDSVVILHLNVLKKYYNTIERTIYEGDTVMFQGVEYSTAGIYPVRLTSSYGCDSIIELRLTVARLFDDSLSVCANELPFVWREKTIYESGIYRDTVVNTEGQTSVIGLKVKVLPIARLEEPMVASICEGDFYKFGSRILTEQGIYYDTLTAANGCDSIVMLSLQVHPVSFQTEYKRIFEGDSAFFNGVWYKESGIYERRDTTANGCTDTYQFILTVLKASNIDTTAYVCDNELPFRWHGYEYNEAGDFTLPITWNDSARVTMTLHLNVRQSYYGERNIALCQGNMFIYKRDTFTTSSIFYDTIPSTLGCDSVIKYVVSVHPTFERWDTAHISDKQSYAFGDPVRYLTITGDYESTGSTNLGCDSIIHLHLVVHPSYYFKDSVEICQPDTFKWHGQDITESGVYYDKQLTKHFGFDSIYEVKVIVHPSYFTYEQYLINEGETTVLHGINITKTDSIYTDTLHTIYGCDSIFQIAVNTKRMMDIFRDIEICDGDYYDLYGTKLTKTGTYTKMSPNGDTIAHINLTVNPRTLIKERIVLTEEDLPYIYGGHFYDPEVPIWNASTQSWDQDVKTTIDSALFLNRYGCDSIIRIEFVVTTHYSDWNQIPLCSGSQLIIDKDTIRKAGFYTFVRRSKVTNRLDSLYRIEVYEAPTYEMPAVKRSICDGDTVIFGGQTFDRNGIHRVKLKSVDGCDSIVTLDLTVNPAFRMDTTARVWEKELPFEWEGRKYYNPGDYKLSWQIGDCDSIRVLHLILLQPDTTTTTICIGDTLTWRQKEYSQSGYYKDTVWVFEDGTKKVSEVYVLHLSVQYPTSISSARIETLEEEDEELTIFFTYDGYKPSTYDIVFDAHAKQEGFRDLFDVPLMSGSAVRVPLPKPNGTCTPDGKPTYIRPDNYSLQLVLGNEACGISRSAYLQFTVKYPSWIIEQNWNDVVAPRNAEWNGGYEFSQIDWYLNNAKQPNNGLGYLHNDGLRPGDIIEMEAVRKGETTPIKTYPLIIVEAGNFLDYPVIVYPGQAPRHAPIVTVEAPKAGTYEIYSSTGMMVTSGVLEEGKTQVTLPGVSGIYFIRIHQGDEAGTHKVLIY